MNDKLLYYYSVLCGVFAKLLLNLNIIKPRYGIAAESNREKKIIISLTSYGRRVEKIVYYTLISLLRQTHKPDKIILWLDKESWNDETLPNKLKSLLCYGVEICYCDERIKSYTKLIPALRKYPDDIIITCDDDMYYDRRFVERLVKEYNANNNRIYTYGIKLLTFDKSHNLKSYLDWDSPNSNQKGVLFALGYCGCLYTRELLYKDILDKELFMNLCPNADDVWFFFMEYLQGTSVYLVKKKLPLPIDFFYQMSHPGSNLASSNCAQSQNDIQLSRVMKHYNISSLMLYER